MEMSENETDGAALRGVMTIVKADGGIAREEVCDPANLYDKIRDAVGGYVETVPMYDRHKQPDGRLVPCVAFCNEEGKLNGLPVNRRMTVAWLKHLDLPLDNPPDVLVGDVVILTGPPEFLREL